MGLSMTFGWGGGSGVNSGNVWISRISMRKDVWMECIVL